VPERFIWQGVGVGYRMVPNGVDGLRLPCSIATNQGLNFLPAGQGHNLDRILANTAQQAALNAGFRQAPRGTMGSNRWDGARNVDGKLHQGRCSGMDSREAGKSCPLPRDQGKVPCGTHNMLGSRPD
jgi:hypothetical protein